MKEKFHYECNDCGATLPGEKVIYLCPDCQQRNLPDRPPEGILKTVYDYVSVHDRYPGKDLFSKLQKDHFLPLLPLRDLNCWPNLQIGNTPLYRYSRGNCGFDVFLKDDSQNPTFSFKDRASALVSAWAKENGIHELVAASTGNAGSSLAGVCAAQGQRSFIFVPAKAPLAKLTQIVMYGATIIPVNGTYDTAFDLSVKATEMFGLYNRNTAYNPLTIEGKKTVSFEIFSQLHGEVPGRIFVPTGDGVILAGVYRGFEDLLLLGIISRMPVIVAVQSEGSPNLVNNLGAVNFGITPSDTIADSISVDVPKNFRMCARFIEQYNGEHITVTDEEIILASAELSGNTGIFAEPAAAAAYAGLLKMSGSGKIAAGSKNVVLLTGSGLKDLASVQPHIRLPLPVDPDEKSLEKIFADTRSQNR
jgi:threonine synthase